MRRSFGVLASAVFALTLWRAVASAADLPFNQPRFDFASQLMLRLFGETSDSTAAFSAQSGDRISESPLRDLALGVPAVDSKASFAVAASEAAISMQHIALASLPGVGASYLAQAVDAGLLSTNVGLGTSAGASEPRAGFLPSSSALLTETYEPVAPVPSISPGPGTLAFDGAATQTLPDSAKDASLALGSAVRPPKHTFNLSVSGQYSRVMPNDSGLSVSSDAPTSWQLPDGNAAVAIPNYAGSNRLSLGAALAVPVLHGVTLNLNYDAQRSYGGYALPGLMNLDAANNSYVGRLTYTIPYSSSSLSISAYQNRFGESVLPNNAYTQTGEDVNFTVKF